MPDNYPVRSQQLNQGITLYLSEKFISKCEIFWEIVNCKTQFHWNRKLDVTFCHEEFEYIFQFRSKFMIPYNYA